MLNAAAAQTGESPTPNSVLWTSPTPTKKDFETQISSLLWLQTLDLMNISPKLTKRLNITQRKRSKERVFFTRKRPSGHGGGFEAGEEAFGANWNGLKIPETSKHRQLKETSHENPSYTRQPSSPSPFSTCTNGGPREGDVISLTWLQKEGEEGRGGGGGCSQLWPKHKTSRGSSEERGARHGACRR